MGGENTQVYVCSRQYSCLTVRANGSWVDLLWSEPSLRAIILSDYGDWSYRWQSIGSSSLSGFLASLDCDYMGNKMLGDQMLQVDTPATCLAVKEIIDEMEAYGDLSGDRLDNERDLLAELETGDMPLDAWGVQTSLPEIFSLVRHKMTPVWMGFWERLWVPYVQPALLRVDEGDVPENGHLV